MIARLLSLLALPAIAWGCSGPPITTAVKGEPTCADFEFGPQKTMMRGGLRYPVEVQVLDDDDDLVIKALALGVRSAKSTPARVVLPDSNEEYTVAFAQCPNERAPTKVGSEKVKITAETVRYKCGEAKVYKKVPLKTVKGDPNSHVIEFQTPPNAQCWGEGDE